uniref:ATP synthase F0 subunit 8 n=1 Tax=Pseudodendrothrips mori TaxID=1291231 RepID=A0A7M3T2A2_9NEOP|nr:ATP synthase F0 subunit 8 [Pseudodendrothrips mori]QFO91096.1 ATP synthase F0 subunit 8 [Pseudodendrothrips mori]
MYQILPSNIFMPMMILGISYLGFLTLSNSFFLKNFSQGNFVKKSGLKEIVKKSILSLFVS